MLSIIGNLFSKYDYNTKNVQLMHTKIGKGIRKYHRLNTKELEKIIDDGDYIWTEALDHFRKSKPTIEIVSIVSELYRLDEKNITKMFSISPSLVTKILVFANTNSIKDKEHLKEIESNCRKIAIFIFERINVLLGIDEVVLTFAQKRAMYNAQKELQANI